MLPPGLRIPLRVKVPNGALEAESLQPQQTELSSSVEDMWRHGADWSGFKQLKVDAKKKGESFALVLRQRELGTDVDVYFTKGPLYGNVDVLPTGAKGTSFNGYSETIIPGGKFFEEIHPLHGEIALRFVVSGKDPGSSGYGIGLDAFALHPSPCVHTGVVHLRPVS